MSPFSALIVGLAVLAAVAPCRAWASPPVRIIAEWEPAVGAMIAWPFSVPDALAEALAGQGTLFIICHPEDETDAIVDISELDIAPESVQFVTTPVQTAGVRDYGPHQLFDENGRWAMLDHRFVGWPLSGDQEQPFDHGRGLQYLSGSSPDDDQAAADIAARLHAPLFGVNAFIPGGNFLVDGVGTAFCTETLIQENETIQSPLELEGELLKRAGIHRLVVLKNVEPMGIQHIDCWMKLLDEERILIKQAPPGHPEEKRLNENIGILKSLRTPYGRPYEIIPIPCPELPIKRSWDRLYPHPPLAAYTNSLILNRRVYVPLFGIDGDDTALKVWREAMPGYEIVGIASEDWFYDDALHCGVRAVFDSLMLRMAHPRLPAFVPHDRYGYPVSATIDDRSQAGLIGARLALYFRRKGSNGAWQRRQLRPMHVNNQYTAVIAPFAPGAEVEYYLEAHSRSGRHETLPPSAPVGVYSFTVRPNKPSLP